jgi:TPR repeat protein
MNEYEVAIDLIQSGEYERAALALSRLEGASEADAWNEIAGQLFTGLKVSKREEDAIEIWSRLAIGGDAHSQQSLGSILVRRSDPATILDGVRWLESAGEQGQTYALCALGQVYYGGLGPIPSSPETCTKYFQKAADLGDSEAMLTLANYYEIGFGVPQSDEKYIELNKQASEAGNAKGNYNLAVSYEYGRHSTVDEIESIRHYEIAASAGVREAQHNLGARYFNGKGVERNTSKGIYFYLHAAASGSHLSQHNLGLVYLKGDGVEKNDVSALSWFLMAVAHGSEESKHIVEHLQESLSADEISQALQLSKNFPERWKSAIELYPVFK